MASKTTLYGYWGEAFITILRRGHDDDAPTIILDRIPYKFINSNEKLNKEIHEQVFI